MIAQAFAKLPEPPPEPLFQFHVSPLGWLTLLAGFCLFFVLGWWIALALFIQSRQSRQLPDDQVPVPVLPPDAPAIPRQPRVGVRRPASKGGAR